MEINKQIVLDVTDNSQISEARRMATTLVQRIGFSETASGKVALIVTECATNLIKHTAYGGQLLLQVVSHSDNPGIEIIALDKGNGMVDVAKCLQDGYSTAGSPGTGLGAIVRLADDFDIYSQPGIGTALLARLWNTPFTRPPSPSGVHIGAVRLPKPGEEVCGDAWVVHDETGRCLILVVDGLGHGLGAAEVASAAVTVFRSHTQLTPQDMLSVMHPALLKTRGAVMAVAEVDSQQQVVRYAGVGNISGRIYTPETTYGMVSHNGTVGYHMGSIHVYTYPYPEGALMVVNSDGCASQLSLAPYSGLNSKDPSLIAAVLYRDFHRERDDVTVVVAKMQNVPV